MSKHTPGPWVVIAVGAGYFIQAHYPDGEPERIPQYEVAFVKGTLDDARLIAAAPDLLACVEDFVEAWGHLAEHPDEPISGADAVDWLIADVKQFQAALAKARG